MTRDNNITTGKMNIALHEKERRGDYLGRTVQVVPHFTNAVQDWLERVAQIPVDDTKDMPQVCIIELGYVPIRDTKLVTLRAAAELLAT